MGSRGGDGIQKGWANRGIWEGVMGSGREGAVMGSSRSNEIWGGWDSQATRVPRCCPCLFQAASLGVPSEGAPMAPLRSLLVLQG